MWVKVTIQDSGWNNVWNFQAEDNKSFAKMAKENGIEIKTACGAGACGICKCKIIAWYDFVQRDKISQPLGELKKDENGMITTIFTCIAWVKSEYLNDGKDHEIVLKRNI
jgi:ferredoxin